MSLNLYKNTFSKNRMLFSLALSFLALTLPYLVVSVPSVDTIGLGHLNDVAEFETQKLSKTVNFGEEMVNSWTNLMNLFSRDETSMKERAKKHMDRGVLKSGEGTLD